MKMLPEAGRVFPMQAAVSLHSLHDHKKLRRRMLAATVTAPQTAEAAPAGQ
jgi:hypothetical protein